jgi:hypothetical protein
MKLFVVLFALITINACGTSVVAGEGNRPQSADTNQQSPIDTQDKASETFAQGHGEMILPAENIAVNTPEKTMEDLPPLAEPAVIDDDEEDMYEDSNKEDRDYCNKYEECRKFKEEHEDKEEHKKCCQKHKHKKGKCKK